MHHAAKQQLTVKQHNVKANNGDNDVTTEKKKQKRRKRNQVMISANYRAWA